MKPQRIVSVIFLSVIFLTGCASTTINHVSADEFLIKAKQIEQMTSAIWTTYIGSSQTRAYLEYGDVLTFGKGTRTIVYWTELNELPKDIAEKLKEGKPPWIPWQEQNKRAKDNKSLHSDG
jgi:hypothetical protein